MFAKFGRIEAFAAIPLPSAFRASAHSRHRRSQAEQIAVDAEAADLALRDSCHDRVMAKLLAGVDVRHVHLDDRRLENRKGVPDAVAVVRPGAAGARLRTAASLRARRDVPDWVVSRERAYDPAGSSISELEYGADGTHANGLTIDVSG